MLLSFFEILSKKKAYTSNVTKKLFPKLSFGATCTARKGESDRDDEGVRNCTIPPEFAELNFEKQQKNTEKLQK